MLIDVQLIKCVFSAVKRAEKRVCVGVSVIGYVSGCDEESKDVS